MRLAPETPAPGFLVPADVGFLLRVAVEPFFRKLSVHDGDHPGIVVTSLKTMDVMRRERADAELASAHDAILHDLEVGVAVPRAVVHPVEQPVRQLPFVHTDDFPRAVVVNRNTHVRRAPGGEDADLAVVVKPVGLRDMVAFSRKADVQEVFLLRQAIEDRYDLSLSCGKIANVRAEDSEDVSRALAGGVKALLRVGAHRILLCGFQMLSMRSRDLLESRLNLSLRQPAPSHHHAGPTRDVADVLERIGIE